MWTLANLVRLHDPPTAVLWFAQAAEHGHGPSAMQIGVMLGPMAATPAEERFEQSRNLGVGRAERLLMRSLNPVLRMMERSNNKRKNRSDEQSPAQPSPGLDEIWQVPTSRCSRFFWISNGWSMWVLRLIVLFAYRQTRRLTRPLRRRRANKRPLLAARSR
jgi:hypothetical protein